MPADLQSERSRCVTISLGNPVGTANTSLIGKLSSTEISVNGFGVAQGDSLRLPGGEERHDGGPNASNASRVLPVWFGSPCTHKGMA